MPRFSLSNASVCLSVTYVSSLPSIPCLSFPAFLSNSPYAHSVPFVVGYVLEGIPRLVPHPTHVPALFVNVLFLHRQTTDIANHFFAHYLAAFVQGYFDDVPRLVHRALHDLALSVGAFGSVGSLTGSVLSLLGRASSGLLSPPRSALRFSLRGLSGLARCLLRHAASRFPGLVSRTLGVIRTLFCGVLGSLGCLARTLGGLSGSLASFLGSLASAFAHVSGSLTRTLAHFLRSLAGTFTYLLSGLPGSLPNVFDGFAGAFYGLTRALADVLDGRAGALSDALDGLTRTLYRLARALADILHSRASALADAFDSLARALDSRSGT